MLEGLRTYILNKMLIIRTELWNLVFSRVSLQVTIIHFCIMYKINMVRAASNICRYSAIFILS